MFSTMDYGIMLKGVLQPSTDKERTLLNFLQSSVPFVCLCEACSISISSLLMLSITSLGFLLLLNHVDHVIQMSIFVVLCEEYLNCIDVY
jgi:hypothetical protein